MLKRKLWHGVPQMWQDYNKKCVHLRVKVELYIIYKAKKKTVAIVS